MPIINAVYVAYGVPAVVAYGLILKAVFRLRKKLSRSFVVLFIITALVNVATYINSWFVLRLRSEPFFFFYYDWVMLPMWAWWRSLQIFLAAYFYYAQNTCALLLTANRFSAVCLPTYHTKVWERFHWHIISAVHGFALIICCSTRFPLDSYYSFSQIANSYIINSVTYTLRSTIAQAIYGAVLLCVCFVANEISFFIISFCVFIAQATNIAAVVCNFYFVLQSDQSGLSFIAFVTPFASDAFSLGPALYTLLVRGPIKNEAIRTVRRGLGLEVEPSSTATAATVVVSGTSRRSPPSGTSTTRF